MIIKLLYSLAFHLINRLADYELSITTMGGRIPFDKTSKYLGVTLDHTLSYHQDLLNTAEKVSKRWRSTEETCQQPLGSRLHNFMYFYTCFMFFCCRILLFNMESKPSLQTKSTHLLMNASVVASNPHLQNCCQSYLESNLWISEEIKTSRVSVYMRWKTLTFFTMLRNFHLKMVNSKVECHYQLVCTV